MPQIRVLIVDDAVVVRRMLADVLDADPDITVAGTASNGRIALAKIKQLQPDLVTLDIEMPVMDGLEALKAIRKSNPALPVIMFSTLTVRGGAATLDALALGATDYLTKPANVGSVSEGLERIREELIPRIKIFCRACLEAVKRVEPKSESPVATAPPVDYPEPQDRIDAVAIGVSTGGPTALAELIPLLPRDLEVPVLIVLHMPPVFTKLFADRLDAKSEIRVMEGTDGDRIEPGCVWLAPGGLHMTVRRRRIDTIVHTDQTPPENYCRPAVDVLFRSMVETYGPHVLGVVMTGMGKDGLKGCETIRRAGGRVIVQDEATSVVWGMPGYVARAGLAQETVPLERLGDVITKRVRAGIGEQNHDATARATSENRQIDHAHSTR